MRWKAEGEGGMVTKWEREKERKGEEKISKK
jgi:hypothetical protein